jgi:hypothetical protein
MDIGMLTIFKYPGIYQIPVELVQAWDKTAYSDIHKLNQSFGASPVWYGEWTLNEGCISKAIICSLFGICAIWSITLWIATL